MRYEEKKLLISSDTVRSGDSPAAVIVCCEAPSGCAGRDSDSRKQDGDDGRQKAGGDDTEHGTGKSGFSEQ